MKSKVRKNIEQGILIGLICTVCLSMAHFDAACTDLKNSVLRLHIRANSDSVADQTLKLAIRDRILEQSDSVFDECVDLQTAIESVRNNSEKIENIANTVIEEYGYDYKANVSIGESYFETREYDDFVLPAGNYNSLIVNIGKAQGKNWWCVVYPTVCLPAADGKLSDSASDESSKIAQNPSRYVMKFKVVEWYEKIKQKFK